MTVDEPLVLGIETSCDETGVGLVRGSTLLADAVASSVEEHARFGGVVPEVASRAHLEAMVPTLERACADGRRAAQRRRRGRGHQRSRAHRCTARRVSPLPRHCPSVSASRCTASTTSPRTSRSTSSSTARCRRRASRCWCRAATPRCCWCATSPATSRRSAPPSTTPRERRSTRWRGCSGCRSRAVRTSTGPPRDGDPAYVDFPRGLTGPRDLREHRYDFSFSGLKTAVARWVETRARDGEPVPVRRRRRGVPGGGGRRADPQGGAGVHRAGRRPPAHRRRRRRQLAAAGDGARSAVTRPASGCGCRGRGSAPTTARWSRRSGADLVARGVEPSSLELPADSSMPVTDVVAR